MNEPFSSTSPTDIAEANARHDREHGDYRDLIPIRSAWNEARLMRRRPLTDKQITQYEAKGWYSADFKSARRDRQQKKSQARARRDGNFDVIEGRMVYRPD